MPRSVPPAPFLAAVFLLASASCAPRPEEVTPPSPGGLPAAPAAAAAAWPGWGGPGGEFKVPDPGLARAWPEGGPPVLWSRDLGPGYSSVTVANGLLITMYRDGGEEVTVALDAAGGEPIWERRDAAPTREANVVQFGEGPNATPLRAGDAVVTLGYTGLLRALDAGTGDVRWSHDLVADFDGEVLDFGTSASPVLWGDLVVVLAGGPRQAALAFRLDTGEVAWRSPAGSVSYATPTIIEVAGRPQLLYFGADELVALDPDTGQRLWRHEVVNQYRNNATAPQWGEDGLLWVVTQLDGGARALRPDGGSRDGAVEEVWFSNRLSVHFWNTLRRGGLIYAASGGQGAILTASEVASGQIVWRERGYPRANLLQAGDLTLLLDEEGRLTLAVLDRDGIRVLATSRVSSSRTWTPPALVGTTLYVRDEAGRLQALDLAPAAGS